jgi:hypothetical protein
MKKINNGTYEHYYPGGKRGGKASPLLPNQTRGETLPRKTQELLPFCRSGMTVSVSKAKKDRIN